MAREFTAPPLPGEVPAGTMLPHPPEAGEQPAPERLQETAGLGLELGAGVSVAVNCAVAPVETLDGPERVSVNVLVSWMVAVACFEGSAVLVAVTVTAGELGRLGGAV